MKPVILFGIIPPLLTPLQDDESIDTNGTRRLIEYALSGGVNGIFVLGTAGEGALLDLRRRRQLVETACDAVKGRVPLLVGVLDSSIMRVREAMNVLAMPGVDAFVATLPFYGATVDPAVQTRFFRQLADVSSRPLVIYNIPQTVHAILEPATVASLVSHPNIIALKDSFGDLARFQRTLLLCGDGGFSVLQGAETNAGVSLFLGADGIVSGISNIVPMWLTEMYGAAQGGDWDVVKGIQRRMSALSALYSHGHWLSCLKSAASLLGVCGSTAATPIGSLDAEATEKIRGIMQEQGLL